MSIPKPDELEPLPPLRGRVTAAPRSDVLTLRHPAPVYRIDEETPALRPLPRKNIRPFIEVDAEDEAVLLDDAFWLVGRKDHSNDGEGGRSRAALEAFGWDE